MAKKGHDLDLSLTGSQILSARSTASTSKKPFAVKPSDTEISNGYKHTPRHKEQTTPINRDANIPEKVNNAKSVPLTRGISDEFLALFESQSVRLKTKEGITHHKKSPSVQEVSNAFPGSVESTPRSTQSKRTNRTSSNRHSIFRPDTPSSVASAAGDCDANFQYTPLTTARSINDLTDRQGHSSITANEEIVNNRRQSQTSPSSFVDRIEKMHNNTSVAKNVYKSHTADFNSQSPKNNMLPVTAEMKKPLKLELRSMQNSYQNPTYNVNKTPVNEILPAFHTPVTKNQAEDYIKKVNMAACIIQHSFKRYIRHKRALRASEAAMKRLLAQKKEDLLLKQEVQVISKQTSDEERQKKREERARQARMAAIEELNRRREEEKLKAKEAAEDEIQLLKAGGKVGSKSITPKSNNKRPKVTKQQSKQPVMKSAEPSHETSESKNEAPATDDILKLGLKSQSESSQCGSSADVTMATSLQTTGQTTSRTTLDDLLTTLKLLEVEEQLPPIPDPKINSWLLQEEKGHAEEQTRLSFEKVERVSQQTDMVSAKLQNILSFLDEVDVKQRLDSIDQGMERISTVPSPLEIPGLIVPTADELEKMEQASAAASEITNTVLKQRLQLEEKDHTVQMLQKALNQQRELTIRHAKETEKEMNKRLDIQKNEYEETVQRHLNFIDQLIDDKKVLGEKCETLVTEMKDMEKKYSEKIRNMQESHDRELAKVKDMILAQEKVKREKWLEEKTKKIKDLTVKGLEPEIQRLISKHKSELKKLRAIHEAELLQADERAGQRYVSMTEELRDQLAREKEAACQRERELAAQRYEKQLQAEEEAYQQARRRLYQEIQDEKDRLAQQASRQKQEIDKLQRQLEDSYGKSSEMMRSEYDKTREEQERRHQAEMKDLKDRLLIEKEAWEQNYMKKQEAWLVAKERELKDVVKQERDREIELVISRLEEDGVQAREECERAAESRIKRIREKYEGELTELEKSERQAMEKYNQMKAELLENQGELERLKVINKQKEQEIDDTKRLSEKLHRERDHVQDVVRQEFADKLVATEEENKRLKQDIAEVKSRHKLELERMKQEVEVVNKSKQEEMDAVHERVKQAIAKKEEVVNQLKQQYQAALKRADHLEGLLEQQRKQVLSSKK